MNLLIFGSSITWGAWDKEGGWAHRIKNYCDNKAVESNYDNYVAVYCLGVSGDNTVDLLERFNTEVKARIDEGEKTLILIEIGINDSQCFLADSTHRVSPEEYKRNLLKLAEASKQQGADLIFVGLTPVDKRVDPIPWKPDYSYRLEFVQRYDEILKEVSREQNIPFVDLLSKFPESKYQDLLIDGLHPSTEGHQIMYNEVKSFLQQKGLI